MCICEVACSPALTGWDAVKINCLWAADRLLGSAVGRERCHSWSIYPQNTCCIAHPRGNPQPTALQVSAEAGSEADFFARIRFWLWAALPACAELGFPILSCREGNERHGEFWGRVFKHCSLSPTLPTLSSLMHSKSIAFELLFLPPSLHFCFLPLLLPVSPLPPAMAQAALWYSPSMLISGSDYTNGFRYGGSVGGREGNPTAPRLGFSKEWSF